MEVPRRGDLATTSLNNVFAAVTRVRIYDVETKKDHYFMVQGDDKIEAVISKFRKERDPADDKVASNLKSS